MLIDETFLCNTSTNLGSMKGHHVEIEGIEYRDLKFANFSYDFPRAMWVGLTSYPIYQDPFKYWQGIKYWC